MSTIKASAVQEAAEGGEAKTPVTIELKNVRELRFIADYVDTTDPKTPKPGSLRVENVNLNFDGNEVEITNLNRTLAKDRYLIKIAAAIANHVAATTDPSNSAVAELKQSLAEAIEAGAASRK